jgi:spore germination protein KC
MKKWLCLTLFILIFTTGCYDYIELNNLAIVSGISIDYEDEEFKVSFEILNTKNREENTNEAKVYLASGSGKTISDAFFNTSLSIAKTVYVAHLKTVIIDEEIARNHTEEIIDFLIRDNYIRNIFYLVMAKNTTAFNVLSNTNTNNPVSSTAIKDLIDSVYYVDNISSKLNFEKFVANIIDEYKDTFISTIEIENDTLKLGTLAVFKDYKMQGYLAEEESATFNIISKSTEENHFKITCPNDLDNFITFSSYAKPNSEISFNNKKATIKTDIEVRIIENHCNMDFKDVNTYLVLQDKLEEKLESNIDDLINTLITYESDALAINHTYYAKTKKSIDFTKIDYEYDASVYINRNGLVFEVKK